MVTSCIVIVVIVVIVTRTRCRSSMLDQLFQFRIHSIHVLREANASMRTLSKCILDMHVIVSVTIGHNIGVRPSLTVSENEPEFLKKLGISIFDRI